jgi:phasin family protein
MTRHGHDDQLIPDSQPWRIAPAQTAGRKKTCYEECDFRATQQRKMSFQRPRFAAKIIAFNPLIAAHQSIPSIVETSLAEAPADRMLPLHFNPTQGVTMFQTSFQIPQQLSSAGKSQLDAQLRLVHDYNRKALEGAESLLALHLDTSKAVLDKAAAATRQLLAAREPRDYLALSAAHFGPSFEQLFAYGRQFFSIAAGSVARAPAPPVTAPPLVDMAPAPLLTLAPPPPPPAPAPALVEMISTPAKTISQTTAEVVEESTNEVLEQATGAVDSAAEAATATTTPPASPPPPTAASAPEPAPAPAPAPAPEPAVAEADKDLAAAVLAPEPAKPAPAKPAAAASREPKQRDTMTVRPAAKAKK